MVPVLVLGERRRCQFELAVDGRRLMLVTVSGMVSEGELFVDVRIAESDPRVPLPTLRVDDELEVVRLPKRERRSAEGAKP